MSVRKAHNSGRNHIRNVVDYYQRASLSFISPSSPVFPIPPARKANKPPSRNRPRKSPIRNRLHHILLPGRRPSAREPNAPTEPTRRRRRRRDAARGIPPAVIRWIPRRYEHCNERLETEEHKLMRYRRTAPIPRHAAAPKQLPTPYVPSPLYPPPKPRTKLTAQSSNPRPRRPRPLTPPAEHALSTLPGRRRRPPDAGPDTPRRPSVPPAGRVPCAAWGGTGGVSVWWWGRWVSWYAAYAAWAGSSVDVDLLGWGELGLGSGGRCMNVDVMELHLGRSDCDGDFTPEDNYGSLLKCRPTWRVTDD